MRRSLGAGAMGAVYQAFDRETGGDVAIKVLTHLDPPHIQRFKNEFRRLADVQHPNLIQLGELFSVDEQWFFTMELVLGSDFTRFVQGSQFGSMSGTDGAFARALVGLPFDEPRLRAGLRQLSIGTAALHAAQIVHRDIKPSNVIASFDGRVVLLDFGLATPTLVTQQSLSSNVVGTIAYMAPEQAAGKPASPSADWYSVGVVLYEALTGQLPFVGSGLDIMLNKQRFEPKPPSQVLSGVPADLDALCTALLRFDPAQRPQVDEIFERLGVVTERARPQTGSHASMGSQVSDLIGREPELSRLEQVFEKGQGQVNVISIRGASGVGKSALAREFCERCVAQRPDVLILQGRCYERESVPYKAFDGVVDSLSRALASRDQIDAALLLPDDAALIGRLFPSLRQVPAVARIAAPQLPNQQELRKRAFGAMRQLFARLARRQPVLLSIDDFQWADPDSLALLTELLRGPDAPALTLLTTVRELPSERQTLLWVAPDQCNQLTLTLENLSSEAAELLARRLLSSEDLSVALDLGALAKEAGGHPLFLQELVRHVATAGAGLQHGVTLDHALWARVCQLEDPARRLLEVITVASRPLTQKAAFVAADLAPSEARRWVSLLRVAHLARTRGVRDTDTIEPYHDRVRECVVANLAPDVLTACHRRIAAALESTNGRSNELLALVFHLAAGGEGERARSLAVRAAEDAEQVLAFERAAALYLQAIELGHPEASALWTRRGEALASAGRGPEAAEAFQATARTAHDAATALEGRRRAAEQLLISGHIVDGMAALGTVLDAIGARLPTTSFRALLSLLWQRMLVRLSGFGFRLSDGSDVSAQQLRRVDIFASVAKGLCMVDVLRGADFQARHVLLALRVGEPARVARALALEAGYASLTGERGGRRAAKALRLAESLGARTNSPWAGAIVVGTWGLVHYQRGRWQKALDASRLGEQRMLEQCTGVAWEVDTARFFELYSLFYLGEFRELSARVPALLRDAEDRGDLYAATNLRVGLPNASWLVRGELEQARTALRDAQREWTTQGFHVQHWHQMLAQGNIDLYGGDFEHALSAVESSWPGFIGAHFQRIEAVRIEAWHLRGRCTLALACTGTPRTKQLLRQTARLAAGLVREKAGWGVGLGRLLQGGHAAQLGRTERAIACLTQAHALFEQLDMGAYAALTQWSISRLMGGHERELGDRVARRWADAQGVADAERWRTMLVPGIP